jgi:hypothetical protein
MTSKERGVGGSVVPALVRSAAVTSRLLAARRIVLPRANVGGRLQFGDGGVSVIYLETALRNAPTTEPAMLVMAFQLRLIGRQPLAHKLFQLASVVSTPSFAGFPGFRSKLFVADPATGTYRGVYEFDSAVHAERYAATLSRLLGLVSVPGSVQYHIVPVLRRDTLLRDPNRAGEVDPSGADAWWHPVEPVVVPLRSPAVETSA